MDLCGLTVTHHDIVANSVMLGIEILFVGIGIYGVIKYIIYHRNAELQNIHTPNVLYYSGLCFLIISLLTIIFAIFKHSSSLCNHWTFDALLYNISYYLQMNFLWITLFVRLHHVFKDTAFEIHKNTIYIACILIFISLSVIALRFVVDNTDFIPLTGESLYIPINIFSLTISGLIMMVFIYKLYQIYKMCHNVDNGNPTDRLTNEILSVIVKNAILSIICIVINLIEIACIIYCSLTTIAPDWLYLQCEFVILLNSLITFICIALTYKFFDNEYYKICGCLDKCCKSCIEPQQDIVSQDIFYQDIATPTVGDATLTEYEPLV